MNKKCNEILNKLEAEGKIKILKDFSFPEPIELKLRLKDMLEDEVDEKYYLSEEYTKRFIKSLNDSKFPLGESYKVLESTVEHGESKGTNSRHWVYDINSNISTLDSTDYKQPKQILINQIGMLDMKGNEQIRRVCGTDGLSPTLNSMQGGNRQPKILEKTNKIIKIDIPQIVKVRKYDVDIEGLKNILRNSKKAVNLSNKQIAYILNEPLTKVEHWFRNDKCFSIPNPDIWEELKKILCIDTNKFDKSINTFIEVEGKFEKANRIYITNGIAPTVTTQEGEKILEYPCIATSRGRYNSDGTTSQKLEINNTGNTNTITSVQRDNYVLVKEATKTGYKKAYPGDSINLEQPNSKTRRGRVGNKIANTLTTSCNIGVIDGIKIRKLTPLECWRLMGFKDEQFYKAAKVCSNTQLYKQAGNSIVVPVLEGIFENLRYIFEEKNNN